MKKIICTTTFLSLIIFCLFSALQASAQDTIYKRTKEIINAKVTEVGLDEIKYKMLGDENGATIVIAKDEVWKIIFANGTTQVLQPELGNPENYASQKKNAIKFDFLAPMLQHITFIYERSLKPGRSIEASVGIIGVGFNVDNANDPQGAFVRFGFKFIKSPDFYFRGMKYAHILKGSYIRPDILFGRYSENYNVDNYNLYPPYNTYSSSTDNITYGSIQLSFGKQDVFDDSFLVDYFVGLGYTFTDHSANIYYSEIPGYGVLGGSSSSPFSISGGLRIGLLIK